MKIKIQRKCILLERKVNDWTMKSIKIFSHGNKDILIKMVNDFIKDNCNIIVDMQYMASKGIISTEYSVMIVMEMKEKVS